VGNIIQNKSNEDMKTSIPPMWVTYIYPSAPLYSSKILDNRISKSLFCSFKM